MRLLCLHGRGTNSDIFESQLAPLISRLPKNYKFDFLDAEASVNAAPGVDLHHPGPYLAWHKRHFTDEVAAAHDYVHGVIEEDGPYDGVIGFSQGAALAASLLMAHGGSSGGGGGGPPPPFKFAILICSVLPAAPSDRLGVEATRFVLELEKSLSGFLGLAEEEIETEIEIEIERGPASNKVAHVFQPVPGPGEPLRPPPSRIDLPTLHVLGAEDHFLHFGRYVVNLCEERKAEVVVNQCGHELPRSDESLNRIVALIENVIELSKIDY